MPATQLETPPPPSAAVRPAAPAGRAAVLWGAAAAAAVLAAPLPLVCVHISQIWMRPHYQFIPLLPLGAAVLAYSGLRRLGPVAPAAPLRAGMILGAAWALLAAAELLYSSWLGAVAALTAAAATAYALGGTRLFRALLPAWLLLWLAVPPPFELDRTLVLWLQSVTARGASSVLDFIGLYHVMAGNVVEVGGRRLFVEEACGGVNSLFSAVACTLFYVLLLRRPPLRAALLLAAAAGWVLAANIARVAGIALVLARWGVDLTDGWRHETVGAALFAAVLALVWSTDRLLLFLGAPSTPAPPKPAAAPDPSPTAPARPRARAVLGVFACLYLPLLMGHFALYGAPAAGGLVAGGPVADAVEKLGADALPEQVGRWKRSGYAPTSRDPGSAFGEQSKTWTYLAGADAAAFSVDYTFPAWHDLTRCYTSQGWSMDEQTVRPAGADGFVAVKLSKPGYRSGYLLFAQVGRDGAPLEPRLGAAYLSLYRQEAALRRWLRLPGGADPATVDAPGPVYQLQLFVETFTPLGGPGRADAEAFFLEGERTLRRGWRPDANPGATADLRTAPVGNN